MLLSKVIRFGNHLSQPSIAVCRPEYTMPPTELLAATIDNGTVSVMGCKETGKPSYQDYWYDKFKAGPAKKVAIAYRGEWKRFSYGDGSQRFVFRTLGDVWIFRVLADGTLLAHEGKDGLVLNLAQGVKEVAAMMGWKSTAVGTDDHGLICAYIKEDGKVYYRNYAERFDGTLIWEDESEFPDSFENTKSISLFRGNDYRTGFIVSNGAESKVVFTTRNWAAMGIGDENISAGLSDLMIQTTHITYYDGYGDEKISAGISDLSIKLLYGLSPIPQVTINPDATHIQITFDHDLYSVTGQQAGFTVKDNKNIVFAVTGTAYGADNKTLILSCNDFNNASGNMTVSYDATKATMMGETVALNSFSITFLPTGLVPTVKIPPVPTLLYNAE
ncbi:MAG: hypothetical protein N2376_01240 [Clostridia bacterium]|nr:hypothetical protein [Clostridia bacterium]